jgi:hypothetical protein
MTVSDLFRELSVARNPNLWQRLSAEKQDELGNIEECRALKEEIPALEGATDKKSISRQEKWYQKKRKRFNNALRDWQKRQTNKYSDRPRYHRPIFDRVKLLMPEQDRLTSNLFQVAPLHSPTGLAVLHDMMAPYQKHSEVGYWPGLKPDKCRCQKDDTKPRCKPRRPT